MEINFKHDKLELNLSLKETRGERLISLGALTALTGYLLSGPIGFLLIAITVPQPPWVSPSIFAAHYHWVQDLPFYYGFILVGGMLMFAAGHYLNYTGTNKQIQFHLLLSVAWTIVFAALITFNYICQTTFVHNLAVHYKPEYDPSIAAFSMANPMSLSWAIEMWGYAFLGIATALMSGYYNDKNTLIKILLILNLIVSLFSAAAIIVDVNWMMTTGGFISYFFWNVLMIILMTLIYFDSRKNLYNGKY